MSAGCWGAGAGQDGRARTGAGGARGGSVHVRLKRRFGSGSWSRLAQCRHAVVVPPSPRPCPYRTYIKEMDPKRVYYLSMEVGSWCWHCSSLASGSAVGAAQGTRRPPPHGLTPAPGQPVLDAPTRCLPRLPGPCALAVPDGPVADQRPDEHGNSRAVQGGHRGAGLQAGDAGG